MDAWEQLRRYTPARIALGRSGISLPTAQQLAFQLAHAQARDAVHRALDMDATAAAIEALGMPTLRAHSAAADRASYLQRPDLGRQLDEGSTLALQSAGMCEAPDLCIVVADGLSALAIERHAAPFLAALLARLRQDAPAWRLTPAVLVRQARVAIGDGIGALLGAQLVLVLIGERPGLSSPDSLGLYLTWTPRRGRTDAERNCVSNVRPAGLDYPEAAARTAWLLRAARERGLTGVALKDESAPLPRLEMDRGEDFTLTRPA
ncbi:ethanolamine ammonia-lyase subunit EutC [Comamonas endophytica]